jgi:PAS domain S-box-containing protein
MFKIKFLRNILLISLAIVILSPISSFLFIFPSITSVMITNVEDDAVHVARHLMSALMVEGKELRKESVPFGLLDMQADNFRLMKMKVFLPSGEVVYSTDRKDIGNINKGKYFHEIVAKGKTHVVIVRKGMKSLEGQTVTLDVAETYVPIMKNAKFAGAFEIYYDITATKKAIDKMVFASTAMLFSVAVVLFMAVVITLSRAAKTIAQREKTDKVLEKEKSRAQKYLDVAGVMLAAIDADQKVTLINKKGCEILGYSDENEIIGKNWVDNFIPERNRAEVKTVFAKLIAGDDCLLEYYENPVLTKDGNERIIAWHNAILRDETGKITGTLSSGEDITERKQGETALCESEDKFRKLSQEFNALLNAIPDTLLLLSPDMKVIWVNDGAAIGLGKSINELTGQSCYHLWHNRNAPCEVCPVKKSFRTGEMENTIISSPDGRLWDIRAVPIKDAEGKVISVIEVARDITEHRKLESQLQQSQKMEAVGTLTGGIAHDFNNILTAIIGYGNILKMKLEQESPLMGYTDQILASADRAAHLTQSLLAFSRKQVINPKPVNLNEITASIEKILLRIIGEDIELMTILSGMKDLRVMADAGQIEQVLMNLAANARDAMPEGGTLTIETGLEELDMDFLKIHEYGKPGMYAMLTVTDTGHGMDENTRQRIFEPFFTTKEVGKGTGLGLSMVYGIIKQHSGYINVYSEPGSGTTFRIYLPVIESATEKTKKEEHITLSGGTETILLAEDEEAVRKLMKLVLEEAGYKVIEAVDGQEAIEKFRENKDSISLLLLDVIMPKINGKGVYEKATKIKPDIKALFSSGYPADFIHKKGILEEGLNFISKPASPHVLLKMIREILDK